MYPLLTIDHKKIGTNVRRLTELCSEHGIEITGITKVFGGDPLIAETYLKNGIRRIGDSRVMPSAQWDVSSSLTVFLFLWRTALQYTKIHINKLF